MHQYNKCNIYNIDILCLILFSIINKEAENIYIYIYIVYICSYKEKRLRDSKTDKGDRRNNKNNKKDKRRQKI